MMLGPTRVEMHEKEVASHIMVFALSLGLTAGVTCGWTIPYLV